MAFTFFKTIYKNMGIDLGTANTVVWLSSGGYVINEPSVIAFNSKKEVYALGAEAKEMLGKTPPGLNVIRPLHDGVIADFIAGEAMIKGFIRLAGVPRFLINHVVLGVPTGTTSVERRAITDSALAAGARRSYLVAEPMAAAIGLGLDVLAGSVSMIIDVGGGTTDIAVISYGKIVLDNTLRIAGDEMNEALIRYVKNRFKMNIGVQSAEKIKMQYGVACPERTGKEFEIQGMDIQTNLPRRIRVSDAIFPEAFASILQTIVSAVRETLDQLPPEMAGDLIDHGVILTGGGALLKGLDRYIRKQIQLPVSVPDNALYCVAEGTRRIVQKPAFYAPVLFS